MTGLLAALLTGAAVLAWPWRSPGGRRRPPLRRAGSATDAAARAADRGVWAAPANLAGVTTRAAAVGAAPHGAVDAAQVPAVVDAVVAQLRAGVPPQRAWAMAVEVVTGAATSTDPRCEHSPGLAAVSAAWRLADRTGAALADVLDAVSDGARRQADDDADLAASLAAPRATARLLTLLPLAGLGLGQLVGAHPLSVLTTSGAGRVCGVAGLTLLLGGRAWMRAMVRAVERAG